MTVILTRAKEDNFELKKLLEKSAHEIFEFPCLELKEPEEGYAALDACIRKNHEYDWVIFLSKKAAEVFFDRLLFIGGQLFHLAPNLKIACIGESTKRFVEKEVGFPVDFCPSEFNSDAFIEEFTDELLKRDEGGEPFLGGIILPRTTTVAKGFTIELEVQIALKLFDFKAGDGDDIKEIFDLEINEVPAYTSACPEPSSSNLEKLNGIFASAEKDTVHIFFMSSQTFRNFLKLTSSLQNNLTNMSSGYVVIHSIGPKTTKTIEEKLGQKYKIIESKEASIESLVLSLA